MASILRSIVWQSGERLSTSYSMPWKHFNWFFLGFISSCAAFCAINLIFGLEQRSGPSNRYSFEPQWTNDERGLVIIGDNILFTSKGGLSLSCLGRSFLGLDRFDSSRIAGKSR
jgi:hypothetical protein